MTDSNHSIFDPTDASILNEVQDVRYRIVQTLAGDNKLPDSEEDRLFLLKAMDGLERTILTKAKIKSDDVRNRNNEDMIDMVTNVLKQINFQHENAPINTNRQLRLDDSMKIIDIVPGEMDMGIKQETYEEFIKRV